MRKLATIQRIKEICPIPNADQIEQATVLGWHLIVKKGEFQAGDLCVYCEIDSVLPIRPEFEFLRKSCFAPAWNGFRIRTIKLRGQISQGIAFPLSILPPKLKIYEGMDVTDILGVIKYDPQAREEEKLIKKRQHNVLRKFLMSFKIIRYIYKKLDRKRTFPWPGFVPQTDEERVQNLGHLMPQLVNKSLYYTEKLDGQSGTFAYYKKRFYVCSRKIWLKTKDNGNYWKIAQKYKIDTILKKEFCENGLELGIQGEIIGPKIQGNKYQLSNIDLYVFNLIDLRKQKYFDFNTMLNFCNKYNLKAAPHLGELKFSIPPITDYFVELSRGNSMINDAIPREGIVVRTHYRTISFKAINPDFLLKEKE